MLRIAFAWVMFHIACLASRLPVRMSALLLEIQTKSTSSTILTAGFYDEIIAMEPAAVRTVRFVASMWYRSARRFDEHRRAATMAVQAVAPLYPAFW